MFLWGVNPAKIIFFLLLGSDCLSLGSDFLLLGSNFLLLGQTKLICWGTSGFFKNNLGRSVGKKVKIKENM